jgi:hypothetical protein
MSKRYSAGRYPLLITSIVLALCFFNLAWAAPPEIYSITPDMGSNNVPTQVTIHGAGFQPTPKVALYGGDSYITGSCDTPDSARDVYVAGTFAYAAAWKSGLQVIDISDPKNPGIVGACDTPGSARGVYITGSYAYVSDGGSGLQVIDISDPANPSIVGACDTPGYAWRGVYVTGTYAYVADGDSGLQVININDPSNPSIVGSCDTPGYAHGVYVTGSYAYVADGGTWLQAIEISDPSNPSIVGACDTPFYAYDVYITGPYAYVADGDSGLHVIEINNPENLGIVGACDTPGNAEGIYVSDTCAYVADGDTGLQVIDIGNPENPGIVGSCDTPGNTESVYVTSTYAYIADEGSGLQVIEKFSPLPDIQYIDSNTLTATVPPGYRPGTYTLHVTTPDGGHAVLPNAFGVGIKMELPAGWSMISLPVSPEVATVTALFPEAVVVYRYQKGTGYVRVQAEENLEVGMGYWLLCDGPQSYVIMGTEITTYTMPMADGWYMIGGCSSSAEMMVTSGKIDVIYGYTQGIGYERLPESEPLEPGKGYWILLSHTSEGGEFTASTSVSE